MRQERLQRRTGLLAVALLLLGGAALGHTVEGQTAGSHTASGQSKVASKQAPSNGNAALESVLTELDKAAQSFKSTEAKFVWDQYQKVVDEHDLQKGVIYFVRHEKDTQMAADISEPEKKYLIFSEGKLRFYQPKIEQLTEYDAGQKRTELESFLLLGFGGRGHDLLKGFNVKLGGMETIDGIRVAKLELSPKADKVRNMFDRMILWVDPSRGVSLKQQFFEPSGDYRLATYGNFKLNAKLPGDAFKLKTSGRTKVIHPQ